MIAPFGEMVMLSGWSSTAPSRDSYNSFKVPVFPFAPCGVKLQT